MILTWADVASAAPSLDGDLRDLLADIGGDRLVSDDWEGNAGDREWFLRSVEVQGHVGIGAKPLRIDFTPTTGIVVVTARNGVGKTSFADGVRHVMSGGKQPSYHILASNLHHASRQIKAVITDGSSDILLTCADEGAIRWQADGSEERPLPASWDMAYSRYRPILLYPEMAPVIDKPTTLHTFLREGLSLDVLQQLLSDVDKVRKASREAVRRVEVPYNQLVAALGPEIPQEFATEVKQGGAVIPGDRVADLKRAAEVLPATVAVPAALDREWRINRGAVEECQVALAEAMRHRASVVSGADSARAALFQLADERNQYLSEARADDVCPVCATTGREWLHSARQAAESLDSSLKEMRQAEDALQGKLRSLSSAFPRELTGETRKALLALGGASAEYVDRWAHLVSVAAMLRADSVTPERLASLLSESESILLWYREAKASVLATYEAAANERAGVRHKLHSWLSAVDTVVSRS